MAETNACNGILHLDEDLPSIKGGDCGQVERGQACDVQVGVLAQSGAGEFNSLTSANDRCTSANECSSIGALANIEFHNGGVKRRPCFLNSPLTVIALNLGME
jgi:hypothetical protein